MSNAHLPPDGARILRFNRGPLKTVSVRLDAEALQEMEQLSERLHNPSRGSLLRYLLAEGIKATQRQLDEGREAAS